MKRCYKTNYDYRKQYGKNDTITVVNQSNRKEEIWVIIENAKTQQDSAM